MQRWITYIHDRSDASSVAWWMVLVQRWLVAMADVRPGRVAMEDVGSEAKWSDIFIINIYI